MNTLVVISKSQIEHDWNKKGFSCAIWMDPPGTKWEGYIHEEDELFMLVSGQVELEIDGKINHPEIGSEVLIPAHIKHSVRNIGKEENKWLYGYKRS